MDFKYYIAQQLVGKSLHFKCDCLIPLDHTGRIIGFCVEKGEIIFNVSMGDKIISISENHPNLKVSEV